MSKKILVIALAFTLMSAIMLSSCTARRPRYTNDNGFDTTRNNIGYDNNMTAPRSNYGRTGANYPGLPTLPNENGNTNRNNNNLGYNNRLSNNRTLNNDMLGNNTAGNNDMLGNNTARNNNTLGNNTARNNMPNNNLNNNNGTPSNNQNLERACESVQGVNDANVVVKGNTAYIGINPDNTQGQDLAAIKSQCANKVKSTDRNITTVYVSEKEDFNNRIKNVMSRMRNGNPMGNFVNELDQMVRDLVPQTTR